MIALHARWRHAMTEGPLSTRATFAVVHADLRQPRPIILSVGNPLSRFVTSRSTLLLDQPLLGNSSKKQHELHFFPSLTHLLQLNLLVRFYPAKLVDTSIIKQRYFNKKQVAIPPKRVQYIIDANK